MASAKWIHTIIINGKVWGYAYYWQSMGYYCIFVQSMDPSTVFTGTVGNEDSKLKSNTIRVETIGHHRNGRWTEVTNDASVLSPNPVRIKEFQSSTFVGLDSQTASWGDRCFDHDTKQ